MQRFVRVKKYESDRASRRYIRHFSREQELKVPAICLDVSLSAQRPLYCRSRSPRRARGVEKTSTTTTAIRARRRKRARDRARDRDRLAGRVLDALMPPNGLNEVCTPSVYAEHGVITTLIFKHNHTPSFTTCEREGFSRVPGLSLSLSRCLRRQQEARLFARKSFPPRSGTFYVLFPVN